MKTGFSSHDRIKFLTLTVTQALRFTTSHLSRSKGAGKRFLECVSHSLIVIRSVLFLFLVGTLSYTLIMGKIQGDGRKFLDCFKREANSPATYSCRDYNTRPGVCWAGGGAEGGSACCVVCLFFHSSTLFRRHNER